MARDRLPWTPARSMEKPTRRAVAAINHVRGPMRQGDAQKQLSPLEAIRKYCLNACMGGQRSLVAGCVDTDCPFYPLRMKSVPEGFGVRVVRVVRRFCLRCTVGDRVAVRRCTEKAVCPVWAYRIGVSPKKLKRLINEKRRPKQLELPLS